MNWIVNKCNLRIGSWLPVLKSLSTTLPPPETTLTFLEKFRLLGLDLYKNFRKTNCTVYQIRKRANKSFMTSQQEKVRRRQ